MYNNKKITNAVFLVIFLILPVSLGGQNNLDSLLETRAGLLEQYREIISSPRAGADTERQIFYLQNQIIETDDQLLERHLQAVQQENQDLRQSLQEAQLLQLEAQREASQALNQKNAQQQLFYGISGALILLVILFLVLTTLYSVKNRKLKARVEEIASSGRKTAEAPLMPSSAEPEGEKKNPERDLEMERLKERIQEQENQARDSHIRYIGLKSEKQKVEDQLQALKSSKDHSHSTMDDPERLILEHQLSEARAKLEDLTDKNKLMSQELQKTIQAEKNLIEETHSLKEEVNEIKTHKLELKRQLKIAQGTLMESHRVQPDDKQVDKLEKKIQIYREQLQAEKAVREKFEKEIFAILQEHGLTPRKS